MCADRESWSGPRLDPGSEVLYLWPVFGLSTNRRTTPPLSIYRPRGGFGYSVRSDRLFGPRGVQFSTGRQNSSQVTPSSTRELRLPNYASRIQTGNVQHPTPSFMDSRKSEWRSRLLPVCRSTESSGFWTTPRTMNVRTICYLQQQKDHESCSKSIITLLFIEPEHVKG